MGKRDVIHKTESAYHIATLSGENGALPTVRMQKKIQWSVEAWFLRYTGEPTDRQTDRQTDSTVAILRCPTGAKIKCSKVVRTYESLRACRRRTGRQARPTQTSSASLRVPSWSGVRCCSGHEFYRRFPAGNRWTRVRLRSGWSCAAAAWYVGPLKWKCFQVHFTSNAIDYVAQRRLFLRQVTFWDHC